jgi:hypothetical protein
MKTQIFTKRTILAATLALVAAPAALAVTGGAQVEGGYIGPLPASWFDGEPCITQPITYVEDDIGGVNEWQVDVSAVANDGNPNTYARCIMSANDQTNTCIVGLADGTVIGCEDESGPHLLPREGDILYMSFNPYELSLCSVFIGTHDQFGEADPKCRETGEGGGSGGGSSNSLGCTAANSTPVVKAASRQFVEGQCYSYNKTSGTLQMGTWSGVPFSASIEDSAMNSVNASVSNGGYTAVGGVANGTIYFKVNVPSGNSVTAQVDNW